MRDHRTFHGKNRDYPRNMSSHHNYINPAFCQQSEFYGSTGETSLPPIKQPQHHQPQLQHQQPTRRTNNNNPNAAGTRVHRSLSMRSMSHRSRGGTTTTPTSTNFAYESMRVSSEQKPRYGGGGGVARSADGPKAAQINLTARYDAAAAAAAVAAAASKMNQLNNNHCSSSGLEGFALVPLSELPNREQIGSRYAFVAAHEAGLMMHHHQRSVSQRRLARSQDDLDRCMQGSSTDDIRDSSFTSLPPQLTGPSSAATTPTRRLNDGRYTAATRQQHQSQQSQFNSSYNQPSRQPQLHTSTRNNSVASVFNRSATSSTTSSPAAATAGATTGGGGRLKPAFSTDFVANKSLILVDQKSQQRYAIVPTADDEDLVDANEEIIQMHNGRAHRYAVIPTTAADDSDGEAIDDDGHEDEAETCLSGDDFGRSPEQDKYATIKCAPPGYHQSQQNLQQLHLQLQQQQQQHKHLLMQKHNQQQQHLVDSIMRTPSKDPTQKLFEILSTPPRKITSVDPHPQHQPHAIGAPVHQQPPPQYHQNANNTLLRTQQQQQQQYHQNHQRSIYETPPPSVPPAANDPSLRIPQHYQSAHNVTSTPKHQQHAAQQPPLHSTPQQQPQYYDRVPPSSALQPTSAQQFPQPPAVPIHHQHNHHIVDVSTQHHRRTATAIITPRLARTGRQYKAAADVDVESAGSSCASDEDDDDDGGESVRNEKRQPPHAQDDNTVIESMSVKLRRATATIGAVSLMLMLCGGMNSALCLYMISVVSVVVRCEIEFGHVLNIVSFLYYI